MKPEAVFFTGHDTARVVEVQRFRKRIFVDRHGWLLDVEDDREVDQFDRLDSIYATISFGKEVIGTFRATRSDRPYLAASVFPSLAVTMAYPRSPSCWEISRFGIASSAEVPDLASINYALMFYFARQVGATALIAIADLTYERFLRSLGIRTRRYGPPRVVGADASGHPLRIVAEEIPLALQDHQRLAALSSLLNDVEISDVSEIFGPARVPA